MPFERQKVEAQLALNRICTTDMPALACEALEAGLDGPAIRRLAALEFPTFFEVREVLPQAMKEMDLACLTKTEAAVRLSRLRAREILEAGSDPLYQLRDFGLLWHDADYCRELKDYGSLDDEVDAARYMGTPEEELRSWLLERLARLAELKEGS
jgi:hypothetical protein